MALMLALGVGQIAAQKNRHAQPATVQVDTVSQNAVDLFSDTTAVDTASSRNIQVNVNLDDLDDTGFGNMFRFVFSNADADGIMGMAFVLCILLILFVLAPLLIIIALFYFINKNRKDRLRLAQMAVQNGQPIPEQLLKNNTVEGPDDEYCSSAAVLVSVVHSEQPSAPDGVDPYGSC